MRYGPIVVLTAAALPDAASAQTVNGALTPCSLTRTTYTQDFDSLASSTNATIPGFQRVETGSNANGTHGVGNGSGINALSSTIDSLAFDYPGEKSARPIRPTTRRTRSSRACRSSPGRPVGACPSRRPGR